MGRLILILGGARSGKSAFAQRLAHKLEEPVVFIATATAEDAEMRLRIARHRRKRPADWQTVEAPTGLPQAIVQRTKEAGTVVIDCLSVYVANLLSPYKGNPTRPVVARAILKETREVIKAVRRSKATVLVVTNEVGQGIVPSTPLGRAYRDVLGEVNQLVARHADEVYWMVAGVPMRVKQGAEGRWVEWAER